MKLNENYRVYRIQRKLPAFFLLKKHFFLFLSFLLMSFLRGEVTTEYLKFEAGSLKVAGKC